MQELFAFRIQTVVFVSCSLHTQNRDVGRIVSWLAEEGAAAETAADWKGERNGSISIPILRVVS